MDQMRFRRLERHKISGTRNEMVLSIPVPRTASGKIYQYSPNPEAAPRLFLIGDAPPERTILEDHRPRIRRDPGPGHTVCPYSGHVAADQEFVHFEDIEAIHKEVEWAAGEDVMDYVEDMPKDFNRGLPRGGFISMGMDIKRSHRPKPLAIREDLLRDLECGVCRRSYGVYAIALFRPDCGAPNLALHFQRELQLVREQIALADQQDEQRRGDDYFGESLRLPKLRISVRLLISPHP